MKINLLAWHQQAGAKIMQIFRWDLQLHFFWGFLLTLSGVYWYPLIASGIVITIIKEFLDLWSKDYWSWGDFWWGIIGSVVALFFLRSLGLL